MTEYPRLTRAPVAEALLDIRVELPPDVSVQHLDAFGASVRDDFPDAQMIQSGHAEINFSSGTPITQRLEQVGKIYWNQDKSRAVQARRDGFTVNWTKNYGDFDSLTELAKPLWVKYCDVARPLRVIRCGLRYINRIPIDVGTDLDAFIRTGPRLASGIADEVSEYFMRIVVPFEDDKHGVITQTLAPAESTGRLILDIDVFVERKLAPPDESIWDEFATLRTLKNRCFFRSLSPEALEKFK